MSGQQINMSVQRLCWPDSLTVQLVGVIIGPVCDTLDMSPASLVPRPFTRTARMGEGEKEPGTHSLCMRLIKSVRYA